MAASHNASNYSNAGDVDSSVTPFEIVTRSRPRVDRIRIFGCDMWEFDHGHLKSNPGQSRAKKLIYLGIPAESSRGYLGFDPETRTVKVCYDVTFDENMTQRANQLRTYDEARDGWHVQEELAFNNQKDQLQSDQVRQLYAQQDSPAATKHADRREVEFVDDNGDPLTSLSHFPTSLPGKGAAKAQPELKPHSTDSPKPSSADSLQPKSTNSHKPKSLDMAKPNATDGGPPPSARTGSKGALRPNRRGTRHWSSSLPSIPLQADDDFIGQYVYVPFEDQYYYGIIVSRSTRRPPKGAKTQRWYDVMFEDDSALMFDAKVLRPLRVDDDHVRSKFGPDQEELDAVHYRGGSTTLPKNYTMPKLPDLHQFDPDADDESEANDEPTTNDMTPASANDTGDDKAAEEPEESDPKPNPRRSTRLQPVRANALVAAADVAEEHPAHINGPLTRAANEEYLRRELLEERDGRVRPLRFEPVGRPVPRTKQDNKFLHLAEKENLPIIYAPNEKKGESFHRYNRYSLANTLKESVVLSIASRPAGMSEEKARRKAIDDIHWDYERGYIIFPQNESLQPGHVFNAKQLAREHKFNCHADTVMKAKPRRALLVALGAAADDDLHKTFHDQLVEEKRRADALCYGENVTALNALMEAELKKLPIYDDQGGAHYEPTTTKQAHASSDKDEWLKAEQIELDALHKFGTFDLVNELPTFDAQGNRIRPMSGRFVYKIKQTDTGLLKKFKARYVARGFTSREGIEHDADMVFAPVMTYDSMRTIISIAAGRGQILRQTDVSNAYLNGSLSDKEGNQKYIYMIDPLGRTCPKTGRPMYLRLKKGLYGLKQAGYHWQQLLHSYLMDTGFSRAPTDPCVFTINVSKRKVTEFMSQPFDPAAPLPDVACDPDADDSDTLNLLLGTYVDDILFTGSDPIVCDWFDRILGYKFTINPTDTGEAHHALGTRIRQDRDLGIITLDQTAMIEQLAEKFGVHKTKPSAVNATPATLEPLRKQTEITAPDFPYLSAVGSCLYIAGMTRPDISWAVGAVARHGAAYGPEHVRAVKRIISYLYHSRHHGLVYRHHKNVSEHSPLRRVQEAVMFEQGRPPPMTDSGTERLKNDPYQIFCDADFAGDTTRRSTMGVVTFLNCAPISWTSRLMKLQALSTTESEIYAATEALKDAAYMKVHLKSLNVRGDDPIPVHEDNQACVTMGMAYLKMYNKARHYVTRLNFLQERLADKTAALVPTPTKEQIADILTKSLNREDFARFRNILVTDVNTAIQRSHDERSMANLSFASGGEDGPYRLPFM